MGRTLSPPQVHQRTFKCRVNSTKQLLYAGRGHQAPRKATQVFKRSVPPSFVSFFVFYIFSYVLSKTMGCFSGCLMSSAGIQKLFCGIYSAFKCPFDEFVGEKVFSQSYSSAILAPPRLAMLSKAHLTSRSRMSGSRSVITPS